MKSKPVLINFSAFFLIFFLIGCSNVNQNVITNPSDSIGVALGIKVEENVILDSINLGFNKFYFSRNDDTLFLKMHNNDKILNGSCSLPFMNKESMSIIKSQIFSLSDLELEKPISNNIICLNDSIFVFGILDYKLRVITLGFRVDFKDNQIAFFKGDSENNILKYLTFENSTSILDLNHEIIMRSTKAYPINDKNGNESMYATFFKYAITPYGFKSISSKKILKEVSNRCIYLDRLKCYKYFWVSTE